MKAYVCPICGHFSLVHMPEMDIFAATPRHVTPQSRVSRYFGCKMCDTVISLGRRTESEAKEMIENANPRR